ncbi:hypothetical protein EV715DRAFT_276885 [Schizophyllum commune]
MFFKLIFLSAVLSISGFSSIAPQVTASAAAGSVIPILPTSFPSASASAWPSSSASASDDAYVPPPDDATDIDVGTLSASATSDGPDFPLGTTTQSVAMPSASTISPECRTMYTVIEGDLCQVIADEYTVPLPQLLAANPGLDSDCGNLEVGEQLCIPGVLGRRRSRFFRF